MQSYHDLYYIFQWSYGIRGLGVRISMVSANKRKNAHKRKNKTENSIFERGL